MNEKNQTGIAITMKGFPYLIYDGENVLEVEAFVAPIEVTKTKRFDSQRKLSINFKDGNKSLDVGEVILRLTDDKYVLLEAPDFQRLFFDAVKD